MVAVSRFVEFSATGQTFATGVSTEGKPTFGTRGFSRGTGLGSGDDSFTITLNSNDQFAVSIDGVSGGNLTLSSGTDLDPRFVARDIAFKLHSLNADDAFKFAQCEWRNGYGPVSNPQSNDQNAFVIWSGKLGSDGSANSVNISSPGGRDGRRGRVPLPARRAPAGAVGRPWPGSTEAVCPGPARADGSLLLGPGRTVKNETKCAVSKLFVV